MRPLGSLFLSMLLAGTGCHGLFIRPSLVGETRVETPTLSLRTDLSSEARKLLIAAAEQMRGELEAAFPAPRDAPPEPPREIIAFSVPRDFRQFLHAHLFSQERAIGFFCEMGHECALAWRDPPGPEDVRVLRHELVHQHLALRLRGRLPAWLEEGVAERLALGLEHERPGAPPISSAMRTVAASIGSDRGWGDYRARRFAADAIFAALEVHQGRRSWPEAAEEPCAAVPPPSWAAGEGGYVLHLLFIRFLESIGEGRPGALGACLARAAAGEDAPLDLSRRFRKGRDLEAAFHAYVLREGRSALRAEADASDDGSREEALRRLGTLGAPPVDALGLATAPPPAPFGARLVPPATPSTAADR